MRESWLQFNKEKDNGYTISVPANYGVKVGGLGSHQNYMGPEMVLLNGIGKEPLLLPSSRNC